MTKFFAASISIAAMTTISFATAPVPGPLLGAVAGPWGLVASVVGFGAYRFYKSKR